MVERLHRQLKAAIRCHRQRWTQVLPLVIPGIRSAWKEDLNDTAAEMVYGQPLRLPCKFLAQQNPGDDNLSSAVFVRQLKRSFQDLRPCRVDRHGAKNVFVFKDLDKCSHVFIRNDAPKLPLQQPYSGPYRVISRGEKFFIVSVSDRNKDISVDRLKAAYIVAEDIEDSANMSTKPDSRVVVTFSRDPTPPTTEGPAKAVRQIPQQTRFGRRVRFPERYQAGFT